jgi:hypothetical protein
MDGGNTTTSPRGLSSVRERKPYGQRAAAYGTGGSAAGVSGLTGLSPAKPVGSMSGLARFGGGLGGFSPAPYTPGKYKPALTSLNLRSPAVGTPGATGRTGMGGTSDSTGLGSNPSSGGFGSGLGMGPGGSSALGNLGLSPGMGAVRGYGIGGPLGGILGGMLGYGSQAAHAADQTNPSSVNAVNGMDLDSDGYGGGYGGGYGVDASGGYGGGSAGSDASGGADGPGGSSGVGGSDSSGGSAGSDSSGGADGPGGSSGWARGGWVTADRLRGRNPRGPDDGYGALDVGELVVPRRIAQKLPPQVANSLHSGDGK